MPAHGLPPRSHERTLLTRAASAPARRSGGVPWGWVVLLALLVAIPAALWWGVGLSWSAMTRDDTPRAGHVRWAFVLDGWVPQGERLSKGLDLLRSGQADSVLVSGSRLAPGLWASTIQIRGQAPDSTLMGRIAELRHDATSTMAEAQAATAFFRSRGVDTVLLVTSDYHTDRAASIFATVGDGKPLFLAVPATEARFAESWSRERTKIWLLEATKRLHWALLERWTTPSLEGASPTAWSPVTGSAVGTSDLFRSVCPAQPSCPPPVECPICPVAEPVALPCPEAKPAKAASPSAKPAAKDAKKKDEPKKTDTKKSSSKAKEPAKGEKKAEKKR